MECHVLSRSVCRRRIGHGRFGQALRSSPPASPVSYPRHGSLLSIRLHSGLPAAGPAAAEPCFARNARARPCAFRGGAPDCACAREGRTPGPWGASSGAVSWNVMFCHGPYAGGAWAMVVSGRRAVHCRRPPRHGSLLSVRLHSGLPVAGPPEAEPCFARNARARPRAFRAGAPDCACARARGGRRAPARPALGEPLRRCVMECHVLSRSVCRRRIGHGRFGQALRSLPPASPRCRVPGRGLCSRSGSIPVSLLPARLRRNPVSRVTRVRARARFAAARLIAPAHTREGRMPGPCWSPLRRCVMECHVLSRSVCRRRIGHGRFWQERRSLPPASPAWVFALDPAPFRSPCCRPLRRNPVSRVTCVRAFRGGAPDCACAREGRTPGARLPQVPVVHFFAPARNGRRCGPADAVPCLPP